MREDCAIHAHDVFALVHRHAPPVILQVALELYANGSVIPGAVKAAIDFARLKNETAPLAHVDDLFHALRVARSVHYFGHRLTLLPVIPSGVEESLTISEVSRDVSTPLDMTPKSVFRR